MKRNFLFIICFCVFVANILEIRAANPKSISLEESQNELPPSYEEIVLQGSVQTTPFGFQSPLYWGPFSLGVSWWYGQNGGNSLGLYSGVLDAADTLSMVLNEELVPVAPSGYEYVYTNITLKNSTDQNYPFSHSLYPQLGPFCEFYKENPVYPNDYWLTGAQMNYHYFGERYLVTEVLPFVNTVNSPESILFFIDIQDYLSFDTLIGHNTAAYYGHQTMMSENDHNKELFE